MPRERRSREPESDPVAASLLQLEQAVSGIQDSDTFRAYLTAQARFHHYSWGNVLLILAQKPDASRVAGYRTWQSMDRQVKRGEKAIRIIAPAYYKKKQRDEQTGEDVEQQVTFFRGASVFDISVRPVTRCSIPAEGRTDWRDICGLAGSPGGESLRGPQQAGNAGDAGRRVR